MRNGKSEYTYDEFVERGAVALAERELSNSFCQRGESFEALSAPLQGQLIRHEASVILDTPARRLQALAEIS